MALPLMFLINAAQASMSAFGQYTAGKMQRNANEFEARLLGLKSQQEALIAREQASLIRDRVQQDISQARALFASRGISVSSGTALRAQEQSMIEGGKSVRAIERGLENKQAENAFLAASKRGANKLQKLRTTLSIGDTLAQSLLSTFPSGGFGGSVNASVGANFSKASTITNSFKAQQAGMNTRGFNFNTQGSFF